MSIINVTRDVKSCGEPCRAQSDDEEGAKVDFVKIFRVEKEVGDTQVFSKAACDHGKQNHPAQKQYVIALEIIQQQLDGKRVCDLKEKKVEFAHAQ